MLQLPNIGHFQKHILDPKNATEALFLTKSKFHLKKAVYLDGLPFFKKKKDIILKGLGHPMHQSFI
jgi:hypothetical protein